MRSAFSGGRVFAASVVVLLGFAFLIGLAGQLPRLRRQQGTGLFRRGILSSSQLLDSLEEQKVCIQGPVIGLNSNTKAAFSKPSRLEKLFSVEPDGMQPVIPLEHACDAVTILSIVRDGDSWGDNGRNFTAFLQVLNDLANEGVTLDLALGVESEEEFNNIVCDLISIYKVRAPADAQCQDRPPAVLDTAPPVLSGIKIFHVPTLQGDPPPSVLAEVPREQRGLHPAQKARRRWLARNRNRLAYGALKDQAAFLWLDTDIERLPRGMLAAMLDSGKDIVVPVVRCKASFGTDYFDKNTWIGPIQPGFSEAERYKFRTSDDAWPGWKLLHPFGGRWGPELHYLDHQKYANESLVPVTSVGGAVLFVRPYVFLQGANFGIANMVGTDWELEGWDAIETEALCWMATKAGFSCWGMPKQVAWHVPCKY